MANLSKNPVTGGGRSRLAPSPTGYLHAGHGRTFLHLWTRARERGDRILLRIEDIDPERCRPAFTRAIPEDLAWLGLDWDEGPDLQSSRRGDHREALAGLVRRGLVYPCPHSRREIRARARAVEDDTGQPLFPPSLRPPPGEDTGGIPLAGINWRFRVPDGRRLRVADGNLGERTFTAGTDFGDFLVWRRNDWPSYELAVVLDDHGQGVTEVVRGEDLLKSTARQLLLYEAFGWDPPAFFHLPLVRDGTGRRLSKTERDLGLHDYRARGVAPENLRQWFLDSGLSLPPW